MEFLYEDERIFLQDENRKVTAEICFKPVSENTICINRTFVDASMRGHGIANLLMEQAVNSAKKQNKKIKAECSYAAAWFEKNPEYAVFLSN